MRNTQRRYHLLRHEDGSLTALTGPAADDLQDGATVSLRGRREGAQIRVDQAVEIVAPSDREKALRRQAASDVDGILGIAHADDFENGRSQYFFHVRDDRGAVTTLNVGSLPSEIKGGSRVRVSGKRSADGSSMDPQSITVESEPPPSGGVTSGMVTKAAINNGVLVILANFNNTAAPAFTAAQAQQVMVGNTDSVANFYREVSYGGQLLNVTITNTWVTMNTPASCSYANIASAGNAAAQAHGYNPGTYNFVVYLFPAQGCGWSGLAYVGSPHQAFINGVNSFITKVVAHEMGHNFGLLHAGSLNCGAAVIGGSCAAAEYGDPWDVMGNQQAMHFNGAQKELLGWISAASVKTHSPGTATYTLSPMETAGGATYAVKIPTASATRTYWLEFRQPIGFDAPLSAYAHNGVQVRVSEPFQWTAGSDDTELLDATPGSAGGMRDGTLVVGQSYLDSIYGVNIIVTAASASAATVSVTKGVAGAASATTLRSSLNPSTAGATVTFTATVAGTNPAGSVNFKDGATSIAACSAVALAGSGNSRTAACTTGTLSGGTHNIVASYGGDAGNASSTSSALSQTVNRKSATVGIATSQTPSTVGASIKFTATVTGQAPTGTVNFKDGTVSITGCSAVALSGSGNIRTASCATSALVAGTHSIVAVYAGDGSNLSASSAALSQTVTAASALVNGGFEVPALAAGTYKYNPSVAGIGWTFSASTGIQRNGSAWSAASAPDGSQTAFIERTGTMRQILSLGAGAHTLSFKAARRECCAAPYVQPVRVTLDGIQIGGLVSPTSTAFANVSIQFNVATTGPHTIQFSGTDSADKTTFIDAVSIR